MRSRRSSWRQTPSGLRGVDNEGLREDVEEDGGGSRVQAAAGRLGTMLIESLTPSAAAGMH